MSKIESKTPIELKLKHLDEYVNWFSGDDFSLDQALQKYQDASKLAEEIKHDLSELKNQVEVIADFAQDK